MGRRDDLVARRHRQGYSQEALAERLGVDPCTVARWEQGTTTPQPWLRPRIARILSLSLDEVDRLLVNQRAGLVESGVWPVEHRHRIYCGCDGDVLDAPWSAAGTVHVLQEIAGGVMDRRGFLIASGGTLTGLATQWAAGLGNAAVTLAPGDRSSGVALGVIGRFESRLADLRRLDDAMGGTQLRHLAVAEFRALTRLAADATESTCHRLFAATAEAARICGWLHFDVGEHAEAQSHYIAALRASSTANDPLTGANVLACMSLQATSTGHHREAVTLIDSARDQLGRNATPRLSALLASRQARAHARAGDATACGRALNAAESHLEAATSATTEPDWIYFFDEAELAAQTGACWVELNQPDRARPFIDNALHTIDASYVRDRALYRARSAEAYLQDRELHLACEELSTAVDLARQTGSVRVISTVRHTRQNMGTHNREPCVIELDDRLRALAA
ncbi:MAG: helix-turn-helix domain-containing protein [Pseudonocardiaceae bacterium]|nr:helix-turn-helix domain-containing protein [Pseudonocardiaceae bacterium]